MPSDTSQNVFARRTQASWTWTEILTLVFILLGNVLFLRYNAFRFFNFFDMSGFMDGGYRIMRGQIPVVDFIYNSGPVHLYMHALFFLLFGFGKSAILMHMVSVSSIVITIVFTVARRRMSFLSVIAVTVLAAVSYYWPTSHPWHDHSAHFWSILALAVIIQRFPFTTRTETFWVALFSGIAAVLSFMTKTNVGIAYGVFLFSFLMVFSSKKPVLSGFTLGAGISTLIFLGITGGSFALLEQILYYSGAQTFRLIDILEPVNCISGYLWMYYYVPIALLGMVIFRSGAGVTAWTYLVVGTAAVAAWAVLTGGMDRACNTPLLGIFMTLLIVVLYRVKEKGRLTAAKKVMVRVSIVLATASAFLFSAILVRFSADLKVWSYSGRNAAGAYTIESLPFDGWRSHEEMGPVIDDLVQIVNGYIPRNESLLVLAPVQILYGITGRDSYRGIPCVFSTWDALDKHYTWAREAIEEHPPDWIIVQWLHMPGGIDISAANNLVEQLGIFDLLRAEYKKFIDVGPFYILKRVPIEAKLPVH